MKNIYVLSAFIFCSLTSFGQISFVKGDTIGVKSHNQIAGKGMLVRDSLIINGVVVLNALRGFGTGVVGINNQGVLSWVAAGSSIPIGAATTQVLYMNVGATRAIGDVNFTRDSATQETHIKQDDGGGTTAQVDIANEVNLNHTGFAHSSTVNLNDGRNSYKAEILGGNSTEIKQTSDSISIIYSSTGIVSYTLPKDTGSVGQVIGVINNNGSGHSNLGFISGGSSSYSPFDTTSIAIVQKDTTKNVGIGTTVPQDILSVKNINIGEGSNGIGDPHILNLTASWMRMGSFGGWDFYTDSAIFDDRHAPDMSINNGGVQIRNSLDMSSTAITDLLAGVNSMDAVNVQQLSDTVTARAGSYLPLAGGTMNNAAQIRFGIGGQNISQGSFDNGTGGDSGISLNCAIGYELNWQGGHLTASYNSGANFTPLQIDSGLLVTGNTQINSPDSIILNTPIITTKTTGQLIKTNRIASLGQQSDMDIVGTNGDGITLQTSTHSNSISIGGDGAIGIFSDNNKALRLSDNFSGGGIDMSITTGNIILPNYFGGSGTHVLGADNSNIVVTIPFTGGIVAGKSYVDSLVGTIIDTGGTGWSTLGNGLTDQSINFIGTTNSQNLVFKRNNIVSGRIDSLSTNFGNATGMNGTIYGAFAGGHSHDLSNFIAIGRNALYIDSGFTNIAIGDYSLSNHRTNNYNIAIGTNALLNDSSGARNIGIGTFSEQLNKSGTDNISIGDGGFTNPNSGSGNTILGSGCGYLGFKRSTDSVYYNTVIGFSTMDFDSNKAVGNVIIGTFAAASGTWNHSLIISSTYNHQADSTAVADSSLITGKFGSGKSNQSLKINGSLQINDLTIGTGKVLTDVNGTGNASWQTLNAPILVAHADSTAQTVADANITSYTTSAIGTYRVGGYVNITAIATNTINFKVSFTDENSNVQTLTFFPQGLTSAALATTGMFAFPTMDIRVKSGTTITMLTTATGIGSQTYDVGAVITKLY